MRPAGRGRPPRFLRSIPQGQLAVRQGSNRIKLATKDIPAVFSIRVGQMPRAEVRRSFITTTVREESQVTPQGRHQQLPALCHCQLGQDIPTIVERPGVCGSRLLFSETSQLGLRLACVFLCVWIGPGPTQTMNFSHRD